MAEFRSKFLREINKTFHFEANIRSRNNIYPEKNEDDCLR